MPYTFYLIPYAYLGEWTQFSPEQEAAFLWDIVS